jgi:arylformamidase
MVTYKGLPGPVISDHLTREASRAHYAPGTTFQIGKIEMVANTGTYVDSPFHRYEGGADLAALPLDVLANREGVVVRAPFGRGTAIDAPAFDGLDLGGKAVLVATGWDTRWGTPGYQEGGPFLTRAAAERLVREGAAIVGIDAHNIDDTRDLARPAHSILLGAGIPIVEHLSGLGVLPDRGFRFFAVPVKVKGLGTFPVRAFALAGLAGEDST